MFGRRPCLYLVRFAQLADSFVVGAAAVKCSQTTPIGVAKILGAAIVVGKRSTQLTIAIAGEKKIKKVKPGT